MKDKKEVALGIIGLTFGVLALVISTEPKRETEEDLMLAFCEQPYFEQSRYLM